MQCNFHITQQVELNGPLGILDVHNAYDLSKCEVSDAGRSFCLAFHGNEHRLKGRPEEFEVHFAGVTLLEMSGLPDDLSSLVIEEVGFMPAHDRDYQWSLEDGEPGPDKHLVFRGEIHDPRGAVG